MEQTPKYLTAAASAQWLTHFTECSVTQVLERHFFPLLSHCSISPYHQDANSRMSVKVWEGRHASHLRHRPQG
jgi:hypothetical protein